MGVLGNKGMDYGTRWISFLPAQVYVGPCPNTNSIDPGFFFLSIKLSALVTTVRGENELVLLIKKEHTMSLNYKALESCPFNSVLKNDLLGESTLLVRH